MKKVLIAALALMVGASLSLAGMGVSWSSGGWLVEYGGDVNEGPGVLENNNVIWQLIYAGADNVANEPDLSAANYLGGDDQMLADRQIAVGGGAAADGTEWDTWLIQANTSSTVYEDLSWETTGYLYQRIWQGTPSTETDSYYFDSALQEIDTAYAGGASTPSVFNYDPDGAGLAVNNVIPGEGPGPGPQPTIPEPATMSLLGLGALAMVLSRKLRK